MCTPRSINSRYIVLSFIEKSKKVFSETDVFLLKKYLNDDIMISSKMKSAI